VAAVLPDPLPAAAEDGEEDILGARVVAGAADFVVQDVEGDSSQTEKFGSTATMQPVAGSSSGLFIK
jgi:hypothetical protein